MSTILVGIDTANARPLPAATMTLNIPAGSLHSALVAFASQSGWQLIYAPEAVAGRRVARIEGNVEPKAALRRLLANTGLRIRQVGANVIVIDKAAPPAPSGKGPAYGPPSSNDAVQTGAAPIDGSPNISAADLVPAQDIIVTGTNIRGETPVGANVRTIRRADIERNGYSSVAQALQALPGNFGGMATEQSALALADSSGTNSALSSGVNLRGLGADATLVLVNGRRVAGSGLKGDFADISGIPIGAVDRVEVLMDGASAFYGSDAVGGVVNIILKDHTDGPETQIRTGTVTDGGARQIQIDQTVGAHWNGGHALLSYEFNRSTALASADRGFAQSADSRPFGGTDHRFFLSLPGNVLGFDAATGSFGPLYAIPSGQNGTSLKPGDFKAGVVNLDNYRTGTDLTPTQTRHSLYGVVTQQLSPDIRLSLDGRYSNRQFEVRSPESMTILQVTSANPYFVSPTGSTSDLIAYSFGPELGSTHVHGKAEAMVFGGTADVDLGRQWRLAVSGTYARETDIDVSDNIVDNYALSEALGTIPDDPATSFNTAADGYFNPYGNGNSNSVKILSYVGNGFSKSFVWTQIVSGNSQFDGPLFDLPGGTVKVAVGANVRKEMFEGQNTNFDAAATPTAGPYQSYSRLIGAGFGELRVPVFGAGNARPGFQQLDFSAAGRIERYDDFGNTFNPTLAIRWVPVRGLAFRGTLGSSFRAPNLLELSVPSQISTILLPRADGLQTVVIQRSGGNPDLKPERAKTWTVGAELSPAVAPGLSINASLFRTIFDRRVGQPVIGDIGNALINPAYAPFVQFVSPATSQTDLAYVNSLLASGSTQYPATAIGAIVDNRFVNTGRVDVAGVDASVHYSLTAGADRFDLTADGTYLLRYRVRLTPTSAPIEERNVAGYPTDFRGRLTAGWTHGPWDLLVGLNYVNRYHDALGNRIAAWTTVDFQLAWRAAAQTGWRRGFSIALIAQNLLDRDPPFYDSPIGAGYDAANASALGRFLSFQITKRW